MKQIAAVIVTYNRISMLEQCVRALEKQTHPCDILVVDNNSSDGTGQWATQQEGLHYRNTGENLGGAGGFNFGMRWAVEAGYEYVWIMDDDCIPAEDVLAHLMEADCLLGGSSQYGFLSSAVLWTDGKECKMNRQKIKKEYFERLELLRYGIIQIEQATFVSLLIPAGTVMRYGLPIRDFFIWGDDIEYTRRMAVRNKIPCYMVGKSQVVHAMKDNSGSSIALDDQSRIERYCYAFRNEAFLYRKEGIKGICYYLAKCCMNVYRIFTTARDNRLRRCKVLLCGVAKGLFFNPKIEFCGEQK